MKKYTVFLFWILLNLTNIYSQEQGPVLLLPENNSENIDISQVSFQWSPVDSAIEYHFVANTDQDFENPLIIENTFNTSLDLTGFFNNWKFFWKVRAVIPDDTTDWSDVFEFKSTYVAPLNMTPFDETILEDTSTVYIEWDTELDPFLQNEDIAYLLQVAQDTSFDILVFDDEIQNDNSISIEFLDPDTKYCWRVMYINTHGSSDWSDPTCFYTNSSPLSNVTLFLPENKATEVFPENINFEWFSVEGATNYTFELALDSAFTQLIESTIISDLSYTVSVNLFYTDLYWRVRAANDDKDGPWSQVWKFSTSQSAPQIPPALANPQDSSQIVHTDSLLLNWHTVAGSENYGLLIAQDPAFSDTLTNVTLPDTFARVNLNFEIGQRYYWRVRAENSLGNGPWSDIWSFIIEEPAEIAGLAHITNDFQLLQNYPNPFNPSTTITFNVPYLSHVKLIIYNILGQPVKTLVDDNFQVGSHAMQWYGENNLGNQTASGTYFYSLEITTSEGLNMTLTKRMIKIK